MPTGHSVPSTSSAVTAQGDFDYTQDFTTAVKLSLPGSEDIFEAELRAPHKNLPQLIPEQERACQLLLQALEQKNAVFNIDCRTDTDTYTLIGCDARSFSVHPKFIIKNLNVQKLTGVEVELLGLADWFYPPGLLGEVPDNHELFSTTVKINKKNFAVTGLCYRSTETDDEQRPRLTATIRLRCLDSTITVEDGESISRDVCRLFSLLLSLPLSIKRCWLLTRDKRNRLPFHFWNSANPENLFDKSRVALIYPGYIDNDRWGYLFRNFFSRKAFRKIWPRLIYCFHHIGAWEFQLLSYVSVLDAYLEACTEKKGNRIKDELFAKIKEEMQAIVTKYKDENPEEPASVFDNLAEGLKWLSNSDLTTIEQKFGYFLGILDNEIRLIIGFTEPEFTILKKIRHKTAHGNPAPISDPKNLTKEMVLGDKLRVLLMYLVYLDFGFSSIDFIRVLSFCMASFKLNANLDRMRIDRAEKLKPFYAVDAENLKIAGGQSKNKLYLALNPPVSGSLYTVNAEATQSLYEWFNNLRRKPVTQLDEYLKIKYPKLSDPIATSSGYIYCDDEYLNIHMSIFILSESS